MLENSTLALLLYVSIFFSFLIDKSYLQLTTMLQTYLLTCGFLFLAYRPTIILVSFFLEFKMRRADAVKMTFKVGSQSKHLFFILTLVETMHFQNYLMWRGKAAQSFPFLKPLFCWVFANSVFTWA